MKKIPIWKNIILIVSAFVAVIIATFAWFYTGPETTMETFKVDVAKAKYIQIFDENGNSWSDGLDVSINIKKEFKEISGDGSTFFAPVYDAIENENGGLSTQIVSFDRVNDTRYYYEQTLTFRADMVQKLYLSPESSVTSVDASGNSYIDGAIRVAFFELDEFDNENLVYIWAPNSTVEYSAATNSFTREGSVEPYYFYQQSSVPVEPADLEESTSDVIQIPTEGTDEAGCGYNSEYKFMWSNGQNLPADAPSVLTVDGSGEDNLVYKRLKIKVWLEGYDRECVSLLSGQKFTMKLKFNAQEAE